MVPVIGVPLAADPIEPPRTSLDCSDGSEWRCPLATVGCGRTFSSGYDLTEEAEGGIGGPVQWRELLAADVAATLHVLDCSKPVIAQVHGYVLAGRPTASP